MRKNTIFFLFTIFLFVAKTTFAQTGGKGVFRFLNLPNASKTAALGNAFPVSNQADFTQAFQNPSLINDRDAGVLALNYSNYIGYEGVDAISVRRVYHNFYAISQLTDQFGITAGFDYGTQQKVRGESAKSDVFSPVLVAQYKFQPKWVVAGRAEYYEDTDGVFISTGTPNGFQTFGYSLNLDYSPIADAVFRIEGKVYDSKDRIFLRDNNVNQNASLTASIALSF